MKMSKYNLLRNSAVIGGSICGILALKQSTILDNITRTECESSVTKTNDVDRQSRLKLKQVQLFYRHGARTPLHTIPNVEQATYDHGFMLIPVPHTKFKYIPRDLATGGERPASRYDQHYAKHILKGGSHVGALTRLGQEQMYVIGQELRKHYIDELKFIDPEYNPEQVYIRSTNVHRTIRTARCILAGMYGRNHLNSLQEPVTIHVKDSMMDELLPRPAACKVLRQINHAAMIHGADHPDIKEDRILLENALGLPPDYNDKRKRKLNFIEVRDDIRAREAHGFRIPDVLTAHLDMIEKNANLLMFFAFCGQHEAERMVAMRLSNGPLLRMLFEIMDNKESYSPRFYLFSCHDSTLVALIAALGFYDNRWPPFGADVRFELYEDEKKNEFVKVSYCGEVKKVRGCESELCPLKDFKTSLEPFAIDDKEYKEVCSSNILDIIAKEMMEQEVGEEEDTETKEKSDIAAGM